MKKSVSVLLIICLLTVFTPIIYAENNITVIIDGQEIEFDVPPMLINDKTMVPMRAIFETLGAKVTWDNEAEMAIAEKDDVVIGVTINSDILYINDSRRFLEAPAVLISDRTLVPLRAVSEALNCGVSWEESTQTVVIRSIKEESYTITGCNEENCKKVTATTIDEFLNAIGDNTIIELTAESYNFSDAKNYTNEHIKMTDNYYYEGPVITGVNNMKIVGNTEILTNEIFNDVLAFENCENITLEGFTAGHTEGKEEYECEGAVTEFRNCKNIYIKDCSLFGCGATGIYTDYVTGLKAENCKIYDCTYTSVWINSSANIELDKCEIYDCITDSTMCDIRGSSIKFTDCFIHDMTSQVSFLNDFLINKTVFKNCTFENNTFDSLIGSDNISELIFDNCTFDDQEKYLAK